MSSYSFTSKDEPETDIFFLNKNNKICHAIVKIEGTGGSKNAGFIRMLYASKKNIDIDKMRNPSEHLKQKYKKEEIKEVIKDNNEHTGDVFKKKNYPIVKYDTVKILRMAIEMYYDKKGWNQTGLKSASLMKLYELIEMKKINEMQLSKNYAEISLNLKESYKEKNTKSNANKIRIINEEIPKEYIDDFNKYHKIQGGLLFNGLLQSMNSIGSMPPNVKTLLDKYGNAKINGIKLNKTPVESAVQFLMNKFSKGGNNFQNELSKLPYDSIYHLQMIFNTSKGRVVLEKNERVNMGERPIETETMNVAFNSNLTIRQIYDNALKIAGDKLFYSYNASSNNCQNFILFLLKGSNLLTTESQIFTKQDTQKLFEGDPRLRKIANTFVKIGAVVNATAQGGKI